MGSALGLAGAVLIADDITGIEQNKESLHDYATISKVTVHNNRGLISDATKPSAISSSFNLLTDSTTDEEKDSIVGNLLEKAIDEIDKQLEEDASIKTQNDAEKQQKLEAEARAKAEEQAKKEQAEAKVSHTLRAIASSISMYMDCLYI